MVQLLVWRGADVNASLTNRLTPLMFAAEFASADVVRVLLEHGADVDAVTTSSATAPHYCYVSRCCPSLSTMEVAQLRLDYGAEAGTVDDGGRTLVASARDVCSHRCLSKRLKELSEGKRFTGVGHRSVCTLCFSV